MSFSSTFHLFRSFQSPPEGIQLFLDTSRQSRLKPSAEAALFRGLDIRVYV